MFKKIAIACAAASMAITAAPIIAQDAEEARTTYRLEYINFAPGGAEKWNEAMTTYVNPARAELGMPAQEVHWLMAGDWEILIVTEMPRGMAMLDRHQAGQFANLEKNIVGRIGSEEKAKAMREEIDGMITSRMVTYSHTHP
ncbi:hypothetical protein [Qipengyuania sphaerica]|uniref:hypothetical protein n=1 Tax=Qipengyuania sphaerica TaxID=2867243 RepID=UPI001C88513E|nr:hypothetical protein [Qipengyuania sphaerica]MBX7540297.1 hypothetical protein [Qipengyuania sphaerica]